MNFTVFRLHGVVGEVITPRDVKEIVPHLHVEDLEVKFSQSPSFSFFSNIAVNKE